MQKHLKGASYPMDGAQLAELAQSNGAPQELVDALDGIGKVDSVTTVMEKLQPHLGGPEK